MWKKLSILAAIFVAFYMGAHYWIRWQNTVTDDVTKLGRLVECDPNQIPTVKLTQQTEDGKSELLFQRVDQQTPGVPSRMQLADAQWTFVRPLEGEVDSAALKRIVSGVCDLYDPAAIRKEDVKLEANKARGSQIVFDVKNEKGETTQHTITFGTTFSDGTVGVLYSSSEGKEKSVRVPMRLLQFASFEPKQYLNTKVMRMDSDNVQVASVSVNGKERFRLERQGADWQVLKDGKILGNGSEEANRYVNRLSTLKALQVADTNFAKDECESVKHKVKVEFDGVGDRKETLFFDYEGKGELSACSTQRKSLFKVHGDLVKFLELPAQKLIVRN